MSIVKGEAALREAALHEALVALRGGASADRHWRVVMSWVRMRVRDEDEAQTALAKVVRSVATMASDSPHRSAGWLRALIRHTRIDAHRRRRARGTTVELDDFFAASMMAEDLALGDAWDGIDAAIVAVAQRDGGAASAVRNARARMLRTAGCSSAEIRDAVAPGLSDAAIFKAIERGLDVAAEAVVLWGAASGHEDLAEALLVRVEARRADAGRPRRSA